MNLSYYKRLQPRWWFLAVLLCGLVPSSAWAVFVSYEVLGTVSEHSGLTSTPVELLDTAPDNDSSNAYVLPATLVGQQIRLVFSYDTEGIMAMPEGTDGDVFGAAYAFGNVSIGGALVSRFQNFKFFVSRPVIGIALEEGNGGPLTPLYEGLNPLWHFLTLPRVRPDGRILAPGEILQSSNQYDGLTTSGGPIDAVQGAFTVREIPEPSAVLLCAATLALSIRRRRSKLNPP